MANDVRVTLGMDTKQADDALKKYQMNVKKAGLALSAIGAGGALAIKKFTSAALEQEKAMAGVLNSARNTGESMVGLEEKIARATAALENKTNFGDEEQLRVLTKMIPVLGSTEKALEALPLIMDAAATTGRDLSSQSETLTKALAGTVHTAESLGITFDKNATFSQRLAQGFSLVKGQAVAQADPFTQLNNALGSMQEEIGKELLPVLGKFADMLKGVVSSFSSLNPALKQFIAFGTLGVTAFAGLAGATILFGVALKGVLATSIAFIATPIGAVIMAIAAAVAAVIVVWKNWDSIVLFFKETLNKLIGIINDKFIGSVNNMIEVMNKVPFVDVGYVDKIKTFETKVDDVAEAIKETSKTVVDDAIPSFEGLKDLVDMSAQQMAALGKGIESLKKPVTEEDKAQDRLSKITERLGLKTGALNAEVQALVDTGFFNLQEALTEISRKYEGQFAESQQRAKNGLVLFNKELERQRLEAELGAEALDKLIAAMKAQAAAAGGGGIAPRYDASMTPADLTPEKLAEQTGISIAAARKQLEDFPQFQTGITNNVSVTVNATTGASADEIAKKAATEVSSALGSSAVSSENTRSS